MFEFLVKELFIKPRWPEIMAQFEELQRRRAAMVPVWVDQAWEINR